MKKALFVLFIATTATINYGFTPTELKSKTVSLTVSYSFANIEEGYDHQTKCEVYIDGVLAATSTVNAESAPNSVIVKTKKGTHQIKVINYALYEGVWEIHTIENEYSQDFIYDAEMELTKKSNQLSLLFDVDEGLSVVK